VFYFLLLLSLVQFSTSEQVTEDTVYMTESGYAEFESSVPLHSFTGDSEHLTGMIDPAKNLVDFYLDLNTLKTGIDRRDRDMYRTLNVDEYPFAEFTGSLETMFDMDSSENQQVTVNGEFTINGETRKVNIDGNIQISGNEFILEASWTLNLNDYNIEPPGILFYKVDKEQKIRIEATLKPRERENL
jgi:polyisoprenoid-binding protein YceI